jgi:hypothetical protein
MNTTISFGLPKKRRPNNVEKYSFPVLTIHPSPEVRKGYKFSLNKAALEYCKISKEDTAYAFIGFPMQDGEYVFGNEFFLRIDTNPIISQDGMRISNSGTFYSREYHQAIVKNYSWDGLSPLEIIMDNAGFDDLTFELNILNTPTAALQDEDQFSIETERGQAFINQHH